MYYVMIELTECVATDCWIAAFEDAGKAMMLAIRTPRAYVHYMA